jgi:hypothetical protein
MSDTNERDERDEPEVESGEFDPESRRLCPDDNCIGVIGPNGKCKVCGTESPDGPPPSGGKGQAADQVADQAAAAPEKKPAAKPLPTGKGESSGFDPDERVLCADDTCTGLVGPDGKCKVCGTPHEG